MDHKEEGPKHELPHLSLELLGSHHLNEEGTSQPPCIQVWPREEWWLVECEQFRAKLLRTVMPSPTSVPLLAARSKDSEALRMDGRATDERSWVPQSLGETTGQAEAAIVDFTRKCISVVWRLLQQQSQPTTAAGNSKTEAQRSGNANGCPGPGEGLMVARAVVLGLESLCRLVSTGRRITHRDCFQGPWCCWHCSQRKSGSCE